MWTGPQSKGTGKSKLSKNVFSGQGFLAATKAVNSESEKRFDRGHFQITKDSDLKCLLLIGNIRKDNK